MTVFSTQIPRAINPVDDHLNWREFVSYLIASIATSLAIWFALDLKNAKIWLPWAYSSDAILPQVSVKTVIETGWFKVEPLLNAPAGQVMNDYKVADNFVFAIAKIGALFTDNPFVIVNVYYIAGFLLASLCSMWFFRLLGIDRAISVALSVLYAIAPYHFARGEVHLILSSYWPLPLAFGIVYLLVKGEPIWVTSHYRRGIRIWGAGSAVMTLVTLLIVSSANTYYAFFTLLFISFFGLMRLIFTKTWRPFWQAVVAGAVVLVTMLLNMLPDMIYTAQNGPNYQAVQRLPIGVEYYSLRLTELLLPIPDHRVKALATLRDFYMSSFNIGGEQPILGAWAALGFLGLIFFSAGLVVFSFKSHSPTQQGSQYRYLAGLTLFALLLGTVGGFSSLIGLFTSELRGWNRISIVIALLGLAAVGVTLTCGTAKLKIRFQNRKWLASFLTIVIAGGVIASGYLDQVGLSAAPNYAKINTSFNEDASLVERISETVGENASIIQFPYREFPETAGAVPDTEQLKPFLHSKTLKWTAGGVKGRPTSAWVGLLENRSGEQIIGSAVASGFQGILIDKSALIGDMTGLPGRIQQAYGPPTFTAHNNRYEFFALPASGLVESVNENKINNSIGYLTVHPISAEFVPDVTKVFQGLDFLKKYSPQVLFDNSRDEASPILVTFKVMNILGESEFNFVTPAGESYTRTIGPTETVFSEVMVVPAGRSALTFEFKSGNKMPQRISAGSPILVSELSVGDIELDSLLKIRGW